MPSISDLISSLGNKAGESADALDQIAESLDQIDFKKAAEGNENLVSAQADLHDQLLRLRDQAEQNIATSKKLLKQEKISGKKAKQIADRQAKQMIELNKLMEDEAKNRHIGVKELKKFVKATMAVNKELNKERKVLRERQLGAERWARNQARQMATWAKASERIDEATDGLDKLTDRLGTDYVGAGLVGGVRGMAERYAAGGTGKKGKAAVAGVAAFAGVAALLGKLMGVRRQTADVLSPKAFNYGLQGFSTLSGAIQQTTKDTAKFKEEARKLGSTGDEAAQIFTEVGKLTGETNKRILKAAKPMFRVIQAGIVDSSEAAAHLAERINTIEMSAEDAAREIEDMGLIALTTGNIQMEDLYDSVKNVAQASNALATSQIGLAKTMARLVNQGEKLGQSYERRKNAAVGLTQALAAGYNQGFATIEVENDLKMAMNARSRITKNMSKGEKDRLDLLSKQAGQIAEMRQAGTITDVRAAEMLQQIGATTEQASVEERMRRAAIDMTGPGGFEMAVARLGDLTFDQAQILQDVGEQLRAGKSMDQILKGGGIDAAARAEYMKLQRGLGALRYTGKGLMDSTLDDLMANLSQLLSPLLDALPGLIQDISWTIKWLQKKMNLTPADIKRKEREEKEAKKTAAQEQLMGTLALMTQEASGKQTPWVERQARKAAAALGTEATSYDKEKLLELVSDPKLQEKFTKKFGRGFSGAEKAAVLAAVGPEKKAEAEAMFKAMEGGKFKKAKVTPGRQRPDDTAVGGKIELEVETSGAAKQAEETGNIKNENDRETTVRG